MTKIDQLKNKDVVLLDGVTSSGKTEIYINKNLIKELLVFLHDLPC